MELKGCNDSGCETLLSEVVLDLVYKGDFKLSKSVFGYEYLNFTIAPRELSVAVHELSAFTSARCVFNYSLAQPTVRISSEKPRLFPLSYPEGVDYSWLVNGLTSSLAGARRYRLAR